MCDLSRSQLSGSGIGTEVRAAECVGEIFDIRYWLLRAGESWVCGKIREDVFSSLGKGEWGWRRAFVVMATIVLFSIKVLRPVEC